MLTCVTLFLQQSKLWYKYFFELSPPMISHVWMGGGGGKWIVFILPPPFPPPPFFFFFRFGANGFKDIFCYQMEINSIV